MFIEDNLYKEILKSMPILCVDLLILHEDKCLLLLRDNEPAKGQYWFPGGRVNKGELIAEACVRKTKMETGLDCVFETIISVEETIFTKSSDMLTDVHTVNICCKMSVIDISNLTLDIMHSGYIWCDTIMPDYHEGVRNPLSLIGFTFNN